MVGFKESRHATVDYVCSQIMYQNESCVRINNPYSDVFKVQVGVHQGSVLSPLLFIIILGALSQEFQAGCPWELCMLTT